MAKQKSSANHSVAAESHDVFEDAIRRLDEAFEYAHIHPEAPKP